MVPLSVRPLFWDIDVTTFVPRDFPRYTIGRVLEFGDERAYAWLREIFSETEITEVLRCERRLSRRSANFWSLVYGLPRDQVAALSAS